MTLQFDIKPVIKGLFETSQQFRGLSLAARNDKAVENSVRPAGQGDQPGAVREHIFQSDLGLFGSIHIEKGRGGERHKVEITLGVLGIKRQRAIRLSPFTRMRVGHSYGHGDADNGLDPSPGHHFGKLQCAEQVVRIRQRNGRHAIGLAGIDHFGNADSPFQERIRRSDAQMHKG